MQTHHSHAVPTERLGPGQSRVLVPIDRGCITPLGSLILPLATLLTVKKGNVHPCLPLELSVCLPHQHRLLHLHGWPQLCSQVSELWLGTFEQLPPADLSGLAWSALPLLVTLQAAVLSLGSFFFFFAFI